MRMVEATKTAGSAGLQERRYRRFILRCPVRVSFSTAGFVSEIYAISENVSVGGSLLTSATLIPIRTPISFVITVIGREVSHPVLLKGKGRVVRLQRGVNGQGYSMAVQFKWPLKQLEEAAEVGQRPN